MRLLRSKRVSVTMFLRHEIVFRAKEFSCSIVAKENFVLGRMPAVWRGDSYLDASCPRSTMGAERTSVGQAAHEESR